MFISGPDSEAQMRPCYNQTHSSSFGAASAWNPVPISSVPACSMQPRDCSVNFKMHRIHFLLGTPLPKYFPFSPMPTVDSFGVVDLNQRTIILREPPGHIWKYFGCHDLGKRLGMLLNTLNAQGTPQQEKRVQSHKSAVPWLRNPAPASSRKT